MAEKVICFLDMLGFKNAVEKDIKAATNLLSDSMASSMFSKLKSFEYFLPYSDSIFIVSNNPSNFISEISNFLFQAFNFSISSCKEYDFIYNEKKCHPLLYRGGVSIASLCTDYIIEGRVINESKLKENVPILFGEKTVEAVTLEEKGKGPRLFCSKDFFDLLKDEDKQIVIPVDENNNIYEILWPFVAVKDNKYPELLKTSISLWQYFEHDKEKGIHYFKFVELVLKSFFELYKDNQKLETNILNIIEKTSIMKTFDYLLCPSKRR